MSLPGGTPSTTAVCPGAVRAALHLIARGGRVL